MAILRVRATLNYGTGGPGVHTSYWTPGTGGGVTADATDCAARVRAFFEAIKAQLPSTFITNVQSDVAIINEVNGALTGTLNAALPAVTQGTGGQQGPIAAMYLVRLRSGVVVDGRLLRGRWYVGPGLIANVTASGGVATATRTAIDGAMTTLLGAGATASFLVAWHRPRLGSAGSAAGVIGASTWDQWAVLRSRRDA
jgi:hypothetical protein